jgi:hypothetical protein
MSPPKTTESAPDRDHQPLVVDLLAEPDRRGNLEHAVRDRPHGNQEQESDCRDAR